MKKNFHSVTLFLIFTLILSMMINCLSVQLRKGQLTPKATDLKNHFGGRNIGSQYGPASDFTQFVEANPDTFMPFKDGKKKIESQVKSQKTVAAGDMTNVAPSAEKIIKPEIAGPKVNIKAEVVYPAVVQVATFKGMKKEFHPVTAYDKETGQIIKDKVLIEKPEYAPELQVMNIDQTHEESIDLNTGKRITKRREKVNHGQE